MRKQTQKDAVLNYMKSGNTITPMEALNKFGCFRLADIIFKLKKDGYEIETAMIKDGDKWYARYRLMEDTNG